MSTADIPLLLGAGGRSRRMGRPKHLLPYRGAPWILWQLRRFAASGGWRVLVVLPEALDESRDLEWLGEAGALGLRLKTLVQPDTAAPMSSSLRLAAQWAVLEGAGGAFWLPVDVPAPGPELWRDLAAAATTRGCEAAVPEGGGHPVWLGRYVLQRLADAPGEGQRLDLLLRELDFDGSLARGAADDPCCRVNLNTPEEWVAWTRANAAEEGSA